MGHIWVTYGGHTGDIRRSPAGWQCAATTSLLSTAPAKGTLERFGATCGIEQNAES
jgi:hypothetical protein